MKEATFIKITNRDVMDKLDKMDNRLQSIEHHVLQTNGKVKLNRWIATSAVSLCTLLIGLLITHIIQ